MNENKDIEQQYPMDELIQKIVGCAADVHKRIGSRFHEIVYKRPISFEFYFRNIPFEQEAEQHMNVRNSHATVASIDFIVDERLAISIKSAIQIEEISLKRISD